MIEKVYGEFNEEGVLQEEGRLERGTAEIAGAERAKVVFVGMETPAALEGEQAEEARRGTRSLGSLNRRLRARVGAGE